MYPSPKLVGCKYFLLVCVFYIYLLFIFLYNKPGRRNTINFHGADFHTSQSNHGIRICEYFEDRQVFQVWVKTSHMPLKSILAMYSRIRVID